jgi:hypothetical protein
VRGRGEQGDSLTKRSYAGGALSFGNQDPVQDWRKSRLQDHTVFQTVCSITEKQSLDKGRASTRGDPTASHLSSIALATEEARQRSTSELVCNASS